MKTERIDGLTLVTRADGAYVVGTVRSCIPFNGGALLTLSGHQQVLAQEWSADALRDLGVTRGAEIAVAIRPQENGVLAGTREWTPEGEKTPVVFATAWADTRRESGLRILKPGALTEEAAVAYGDWAEEAAGDSQAQTC